MTENTTTDVVLLKIQIEEGGSSGKTPEKAKKEVDALAGSILGLQQANKKLREERKLLDTTDAASAKRIKEINALIDQNDKAIKSNSSSLEKQRLNVGNYTGALDKLVPGLGATIQGFVGMTKASLAFIATPIGAIIAALGLALAAVTAYFKGSEEGADKFAKVSAQVSAVVRVVTDRLIQLGGALVAFLSGDFEGGLNKLEGAFSGVGDEIAREVQLAGELADMLDRLEERELKYSLAVSQTANEIKKLIIESKNRTLAEEERIAKLEEATQKEIKLNEELLKIQKNKILATATQIQADFSQLEGQRKTTETVIEFAKRIVANEDILIGRRKELADLIIAYDQAQGDSLNLQEQIQNKRDALEQKAIDDRNKRIEKETDERRKAEQEEDELQEERRQLRLQVLEEEMDRRHKAYLLDVQRRKEADDMVTAGIARVADTLKKQRDADDKEAKKSADRQIQIENYKNQAISGGIELITKEKTAARYVLNGIFKADAIKETIINTKDAAMAAYKSLAGIPYVGPFLGAAAAATVGIFGASQVAGIIGIQFAKGGRVGDKRGTFSGRLHSHGGEDYVNTRTGHLINVEAGENFYVMNRSASKEVNYLSGINVKHGGRSWEPSGAYPGMRSFAQGGFVAQQSQAVSQLDIERTVRTVMQTMPPIYVVAQDVSTVLDTDNQIKTRARVI